MAINTSNNLNENSEKSTKNNSDIKSIFIKDFVSYKLSNDKSNAFLNKIISSFEFDIDDLNDINTFSKGSIADKMTYGNDLKSKYQGLDITSINIRDIQIELLSFKSLLDINRKKLINELISEYDIDSSFINKYLQKEINKLSVKELSNLIGQNKIDSRTNFLKNILGESNLPISKITINKLSDLYSKIDVNDRSKKVLSTIVSNHKNDIKNDLDNIISRFNSNIFSSQDFQSLFNYGFFNDNEKIELIQLFLPNITFKEALENGIVDLNYIENYKKDLIKEYVGKYNLDKDEIDYISELINNDEIYISTLLKQKSINTINNICKNIYFKKIDKLEYNDNENDGKEVEIIKNIKNFIEKEKKYSIEEIKSNFLNFSDKKVVEKFKNIEKFQIGNYLVVNVSKNVKIGNINEEKNHPIFFRILDIKEDHLSVFLSGSGEINLYPTVKKDLSKDFFSDIIKNGIDLYKLGTTKLDIKDITFESIDTIDKKITEDKYVLHNKNISNYDKDKLIENEKYNNELILNYIAFKKSEFVSGKYDNRNEDLNDLLNEIEKFNKKLLNENNPNNKIDIEDKISKLQDKISNIEKEIYDDIKNNFNNQEDIIKIKNKIEENNKIDYDSLLKSLLDIDSEGHNLGLDKGLSFVTKDGIYTITNNPKNSNFIDLSSPAGDEKSINFELFFEIFKKREGKRLSNINNFDTAFLNIKNFTDISKIWSDYDYKDGAIKKKNTKTNLSYDYIIATDKDSNEIIKIHDISGDDVTISFGEYDEHEKDKNGNYKKDKDGKKIKKESFTLYSNTTTKVSPSWIEAWVKDKKGIPRSTNEYKDKKDENVKGIDFKHSLWSKFLNNISLKEGLAGGKFFLESIENYLKEGNEEHAALFASSYLGKILPNELQSDLMSRTENSQKKRAEDYVNKLSDVDSWKATELIAKRLKNKNTPEYKKEAAVIFMLQKYGVLYAKSGLHKYKGKYLFYESLGGKIGDKLYNEVKNDADKLDENFREEELVYKLLVKQCGSSGYNGIKRRSRLHKDVKKHRNVGKQGEIETGTNDAKDERTVDKRIDGAMGELKGGTYSNATGWLGEVVNKGGSMKDMNKVPFVMAFSGVGYTFEQNILDALKNFPSDGKLLVMLRMMSYKSDIKLLNETILELCKRIGEIEGNDSIYKEAKDIFDNHFSNSIEDYEKITETEKFYNKYGDVLTRSLYMLNDGKDDKKSYYSKIIRIEKDDHEINGKKVVGNSVFKRYIDKMDGYSGDYIFDNDDLQSDGFAGAGTSGISMHNSVKVLLEKNQSGGYRMKKSGDIFFKEIKKELEAIIKRDYGIYGEFGKKEDLKHFLKGLISGLLEAHGGNINALYTMVNSNTSDFASMIHSKGLDFNGIFNYSSNDVIDGKADNLINEYINILLNKQGSTGNYDTEVNNFLEPTSNLINKIKDSTSSTLYDEIK